MKSYPFSLQEGNITLILQPPAHLAPLLILVETGLAALDLEAAGA